MCIILSMDYEKLGAFYLGHQFDPATKSAGDAVMYDARNLTTHAACVGTEGSGKTGLCIEWQLQSRFVEGQQ